MGAARWWQRAGIECDDLADKGTGNAQSRDRRPRRLDEALICFPSTPTNRTIEQETRLRNLERKQLLIGGRRIRILDLIEGGLLVPGQDLVFKRPRAGARYDARVESDGSLTIEGRRYTSPSSAASAVAEVSLDGWHAWQVGDGGPYLHKLREQLLDQQKPESTGADGDERVRLRQEFLATVDERGVSCTVRELLAYWGADSRSQLVADEIDADLVNYDLLTTPNYLKVGMEDVVLLHRRRTDTDRDEEEAADDDAMPTLSEIGITLGNISFTSSDVVKVSPDSSLDEAITLMLLNDFSQLPVVAGPRSVKGAVTWQSIARARHRDVEAKLRDAMIPALQLPYDKELVDVLSDLQKHDFVLVMNAQRELTGIVTTADVVDAYGRLATPFLLIGELDQILRRVISDHVDIGKVSSICHLSSDRRIVSFSQLTMAHYEAILRDDSVWETLNWPLDRNTFLEGLSDLRKVRNDVVHFNRDTVPTHVINQFRQMIRLLREYIDG
ncbi:CBS domain-containing protein [Gordonia hankookensis]|uniref:CBS domain-containing protein n=1 Tax=Gordonia hankookensis TaxID=589403 RepID=A0ABR7WDU3_9ACTN|nr:CBS domain-containing protein [Gordonia hankookensis]MBD1320563.1 CBS domain-containing protein [Gordonia hankookensis]